MLMRLFTFGLLALASASPASKREFDWTMSGQYTVANCGGNTTLVVNTLRALYSALLPVIEDAKSANPSVAYTAFFKNSSYAPFVSTLFTNATEGVPMTPRARYSVNGAVTFLCVTAPDQFTFTLDGPRDAYDECAVDPSTGAKYIAFAPPQPYVILCPSFFTSGKALAPPPNTCLPYNSYLNRFQSNGQEVRQYLIWFLLEMLAHYYVYTSTGRVDLSNNSNANACFRLDAERSRLSVNNYVYYAASVYGHCRGLPVPRDRDRELSEVGKQGLSAGDDAGVSSSVATDLVIDGGLG